MLKCLKAMLSPRIEGLESRRLLSGAVRKGHSSANKRSVPAVGSVICVIYDPDNPRRNAVYPFSLVELENVR